MRILFVCVVAKRFLDATEKLARDRWVTAADAEKIKADFLAPRHVR